MKVAKKVILLFLFLQFTKELCTDGCLKCDGQNNCLICDAQSLYVNVNGSCKKQDLEFCLYSLDLFTCVTCYPGYYLETNRKCVTNPNGTSKINNCLFYSTYTRCAQCIKNYYLAEDHKSCKKVETQIKNCKVYKDAKTCLICADSVISQNGLECFESALAEETCMFYSENTSCAECFDGYYLNPNYYIDNLVETYDQIIDFYNEYNRTFKSIFNIKQCQIIPAIDNCAKMTDDFRCEECNAGYYIEPEAQKKCIKNPEEYLFFSSTDIPFCYKHHRIKEIVNNVPIITVTCFFCYEGYYISVDKKKCQKHTSIANHCKINSQTINGECILCDDGYYRFDKDGEKCIERGKNLNCSIPNPLSEECQTCIDETYVKHMNNRFCSAPIIKCTEYETNHEILACKICIADHYYNASKRVCELNPNFDAYCTYYNENQKCAKCNNGFFYNIITERCEANDPEYLHYSNCEEYAFQSKNVCINCPNNRTSVKVNYVCKMFNDDVNFLDSSTVKHCDQFEVDLESKFKCRKPYNGPLDDGEVGSTTYFVSEETNKPVANANDIAQCKTYNEFHPTSTGNLCSTCDTTITLVDSAFSMNNVCEINNPHPICVGTSFFRSPNAGNKEFCYQPLNMCGRFVQGGLDKNNCPYCNWVFARNLPNCIWTEYPNQCEDRDGTTGYCKRFYGTSCSNTTTFYRTVTYDIFLSEDKKFCIQEQIYSTENCYLVSGGICLLCRKDYYPERYKVFELERDVVVSYQSKSDYSNSIKNCIVFNSILDECDRCDAGYALIALNNKACTLCTAQNRVLDTSGLYCQTLITGEFDNSECAKGLVDNVDPLGSKCLECKPEYLHEFSFKAEDSVDEMQHVYVNGEKTFLTRPAKNFKVKGCYLPELAFYSDVNFVTQNQFCSWGIKSNDNFLCLQCKYGYWGELELDKLGQKFVQNCVKDPSCNNVKRYIIREPHIAKMVSCHACSNLAFVPTIFLYPKSYADQVEYIMADNPSSKIRPSQCYTRATNVDVKCLVQMRITETSLKNAITPHEGNVDYICVSCQPKYKPVYQDIGDLFPFKYVKSCQEISNCQSSYTANKCEECEVYVKTQTDIDNNTAISGFILEPDQETCSTKTIDDLDQCKTLVQGSSSILCDKCKDGYIKADKCVSIFNEDCQFYESNRCVQSKLQMGILFNIVFLDKYNGYSIPQANCSNSGLNKIEKCDFYTENKTCFYCQPGYHVGNNGNNCYERNVLQCTEYDDVTMLCTKCASGYDLNAVTNQCNDAFVGNIVKCIKYSNGFCTECETGFYPFKINNASSSICIDISTNILSTLCEEVDTEVINTERIINCTKCKTLSQIKTDVNNGTYQLTEFDFIFSEDFFTSVSADRKINYSTVINTYPYVRAAIFKKNNKEWCRTYGGIANCAEHDDRYFDDSFRCIECNASHYLQNNTCIPRDSITNCIVYEIEQNACKTFLGQNNYSITYSSFDEELIAQNPPAYSEELLGDIGIENCSVYDDLNRCKICKDSLYLYDNLCLNVTKVIPDCAIYTTDGICHTCREGFLLFQNKCLTKYAENCETFLTNTNCMRCTPENPIHGLDGSCDKNSVVPFCESYSFLDTCFYCNTEYQNNKGNCITNTSFVENCERNGFGGTCQKCLEGYYVGVSGKECIPNPIYDRHCKTFEAKNNCIICEFNYYFRDNACYPCKTNPNSCLFCNSSDPTKCEICKSGFFMDNDYHCIQQNGFVLNVVDIQFRDEQNLKYIRSGGRRIITGLVFLIGLMFSN